MIAWTVGEDIDASRSSCPIWHTDSFSLLGINKLNCLMVASYLYPLQVWKTLECTNIKIKSNNTYLVNHLGLFHPISQTINKICRGTLVCCLSYCFACESEIFQEPPLQLKRGRYTLTTGSVFYLVVALHVTVNEFRCYEAEIEEWEKAGSHRQSSPGHLWLEPPVLCTFLYFCLITSKFISSVRQDALSI